MNEWKKLIEELEKQGLTPEDVRRILFVYHSTIELDKNSRSFFNEDQS